MIKYTLLFAMMFSLLLTSCYNAEKKTTENKEKSTYKMAKYAEVKLTTDISHLSDNQKEMLKKLFEAADVMEQIFWLENIGDK